MKKIFSKSGILVIFVIVVWCIWFWGLFSKYREVHKQNEDVLILDVLFVIATLVVFLAIQMIVKKQMGIRFEKSNNIGTIDKIFISLGLYAICTFINLVFTVLKSFKPFKFLQGTPSNQERLNEQHLEDGLWHTLFVSGVNTPILEEIIFRGIFFVALYIILISIIKSTKKHTWTLLLNFGFIISTSIFFSYLHVNEKGNYQFIILFLPFAITLAIVYLITKNILYTMALHSLFNVQSTLNFFAKKNMVNDSVIRVYIGIISLIIIFLLAYAFYLYFLRYKDLYIPLKEKVRNSFYGV
ncbi:CPBP family intramembrane glutamic endopeptidase [Staphylococcus succinus]|uniref:CPBP family intramembrane glutamic endopeptidase n=1 Tax=Staphylococcus succinus TaxID=61015 RepID=UPI000E6854B4|nr:type II CAAX endopeptidase family protein [Staphylococcus succinus]RIN27745.1 CPBP family intramembrane metalloprotease [Staphylococcus succinus]